MVLSNEWFSAVAESDEGHPIFIAGREAIDGFRSSQKFPERVEIYWRYEPTFNQLPSDQESFLMEEVTELLKKRMEKDKLAILTGIYTGDGERTLVFYTRTARVFGERLNEVLAPYPPLPLTLYVEKDAEWGEYAEMVEAKPYGE